jgi:hypothetical protein
MIKMPRHPGGGHLLMTVMETPRYPGNRFLPMKTPRHPGDRPLLRRMMETPRQPGGSHLLMMTASR